MIPDGYNSGDLLWLGDWGPVWIVVLTLIGVLVIGVSAYDLRGLKPLRRFTLVTLRALVYLCAVVMLLEPALDLKNISRVKNHVAVVVDTSESMSLKLDEDGTTRMSRVHEVLPDLAPYIEQHKDDHIFHFFSYGEQAEGILQSSREELESSSSDGKFSDLGSALKAVDARFVEEELGGVIVYSDGIDSGAMGNRTRRGEALDSTSKSFVESLGVPINTVAAASQEGLRDVAIARVMRDDFAFVHNKVSVDVEVQVIGVPEQPLTVTLARGTEELQTRQIQLTKDQTLYKVRFEFVPRQIGQEIYSVKVPVLENEALITNNQSMFLLRVIRDKIRALQVVGRPSWDERFMRRLLKRDPNIDLISFFILRTGESLSNASRNELSLIPFPTSDLFDKELGSFDLVIFQNFNFGPYNMRQYLPKIEEFVKKGGGFVMIGGDLSFASGGYARTAIEEALPVGLPAGRGKLIDTSRFRPELTKAGLRHPITQLAFDPATNTQLWATLPEQRGTNIVGKALPGATVLATHPKLRAGGKPMPVITIGSHGEGRVMAMTTDSTWRWGFESLGDGGTPREYQLFWHNAMRWLIKDPELKLVKLELAEDTTHPDARVEIGVRVSNSDYSPAQNRPGEVVITHTPHTPTEQPLTLEPLPIQTNSAGVAQIEFVPERTGVYELVARVNDEQGDPLEDRQLVLVVPDLREFQTIIPRDDLLEAIATQTDGAFSNIQDASKARSPRLLEPRTVKVNRRKVIQLWDSALAFLLIMMLLGAEWTLRRRWGRL